MTKAREYAKRLTDKEGYERQIIGMKLCDAPPAWAEDYGSDISFLCAIAAEVWDGRKPFYITNKNIQCGGAVYGGLGSRPLQKEDFDMGMEGTTIGVNCAYASRQVFRRVNQQFPHFFKHHRYMVIGALEDFAEDPDIIMITADANRIMRVCKVYTWKTGELVHSLQGTAWCANALPLVFNTRSITFNLGDPPSRVLMQLDAGEAYCMIHWDVVPTIVENFDNISDGMFM